MEILKLCIHKIDIEASSIEIIKSEEYGIDFTTYLEGLIEIATTGGSARSYNFEGDTEVHNEIKKIPIANDENFQITTRAIAERLLKKEAEAQVKIAKLKKEIQKGILVQVLIEVDGVKRFLICKVDHSDFLREKDLTIQKGLPVKKKVFKSFVCTLKDDSVDNIWVHDSTPSFAKYWWKEFLELDQIYTDEDNTESAYKSIMKALNSKLRAKHPRDYMTIWNSTVRYFRAKEKFDMNDYIENAIGDFVPVDSTLAIDKLKEVIQELPNNPKKPFDEQFIIKKSKIRTNFLKKIPLTDTIELHLKQDIDNIDRTIQYHQDDDGTKYVKIRSTSGYNFFKKRDNPNG